MEQLSVSYIPIKDITPYENNPRRNEDAVSKVADSIREFGWQQPIVVDSNNVIIVGHTRYKAALELGMTQVPVHVATELTEEQVRAYRLVDNKTNEFAEWDFTKLQDELSSIDDVDMMSEFGFFSAAIDWQDVKPLTKTTYEPPKHDMIRCPKCGHVDRKEHFVPVNIVEPGDGQTEAEPDVNKGTEQ